jgi:hypothetical protein
MEGNHYVVTLLDLNVIIPSRRERNVRLQEKGLLTVELVRPLKIDA